MQRSQHLDVLLYHKHRTMYTLEVCRFCMGSSATEPTCRFESGSLPLITTAEQLCSAALYNWNSLGFSSCENVSSSAAAHLQDGVGVLAVEDDNGAALLGRHPGRLHLGHHAAAPVRGLAGERDHLLVHLQWACREEMTWAFK